jgi:hypothetical protein
MTQDWSMEPWHLADGVSGRRDTVVDCQARVVAVCAGPRGEADAARIVACVNAVADIPTGQLENGPLLRAAQDLHAALRQALRVNDPVWRADCTPEMLAWRAQAMAALARAEGGEPCR